MNSRGVSAAFLFVGLLGCRSSAGGAPDASGTGGAATGGSAGGAAGAPNAGASGDASAGQGGDAGAVPGDAGIDRAAPDGGADATSEVIGSGCAGPGTLCWGFEEGRLPDGWTPYRNEFTGDLVVDGTRAHRGTYALHAKDFKGGTEGAQGGPKKTIRFTLPSAFGPVLWGRAYVYTTPARAMSHAGFFNARYPRPSASSTAFEALDWYEAATYTGSYMTVWHPPEPPGYPEAVQVSGTSIVLDNWVCLEWEFDGQNGTAPEAAEPRLWLDGVELAWPNTFVYPDGATRPTHEKVADFTVLETGIYLYQGLVTVTNWWIDDLAVGRERIGCE